MTAGKETPVLGSTEGSPGLLEAKEREPQRAEERSGLAEAKKSQAFWRNGSLWFVILWEMAMPIPTPIVTAAAAIEVAMAAPEIEGDDNPLDFGGLFEG